jgi:hypothetical protein
MQVRILKSHLKNYFIFTLYIMFMIKLCALKRSFMTISAYFRSREALSLQCSLSASTVATVQHTLPLRNADQSSILRLVVAELEFALLAVASLVEAVVHIIFMAILGMTLLVLKCCLVTLNCYEITDYFEISSMIGKTVTWKATGAYISIQNAFFCLAALFVSISRYSAELKYEEILPSYFEYLTQGALTGSPEDIVLMPRENNPHLTRLLNRCRESIREISSQSLRRGVVLPIEGESAEPAHLRSYIDMKITFNGLEFSDERLYSGAGPISSHQELEPALQQCKTAMIEKLEQRFARSVHIRAVDFVELPREVKINCQVTHQRTLRNAYKIIKIGRTGNLEGTGCELRSISADELARLRS